MNGSRHARGDESLCLHVDGLEGVVKSLVRADDWTRRLSGLVGDELQAARCLWAFERLVKHGCVPDALANCISAQQQRFSESELTESELVKSDDSLNRRGLTKLSQEFDQLAENCDNYFARVDEAHAESFVHLYTATWLRNEAARFRAAAAFRDPRERHTTTRAEAVLLQTMTEVKIVTGKYRDELLAEILRHIPLHTKTTGEGLRKARQRAQAWGQRTQFRRDRAASERALGLPTRDLLERRRGSRSRTNASRSFSSRRAGTTASCY